MNAIRKKLTSHETGVKAIEAETADMMKIYSNARNAILAKIARYSQKNKDPLAGKYLIALNETLMKEYAALEEQFREWGGGNIPYIAQSYYHMALVDLDAKGSGAVGGFNKERVKNMTDDYYRHIAGATKNMADQDIRYLRNMSAQVFRTASLTGKSRPEITREMLSKVLDLPGFKFIDKGGRRWNTENYFEMLGRTVLLNSGRETYANTCADKGKDVVRITRGADSCPVCDKYENKLLSLTGKTEGLPTLDQAIAEGLFHPNCVHSMVAVPGYEAKTEIKNIEDIKEAQTFPMGIPVSNALEVTKSAISKNAEYAIAIIDKIHGDGNLSKIPIKQSVAKSKEAAFKYQPSNGLPISITISKFARDKEMSALHEIGHFIDLNGIGAGKFDSNDRLSGQSKTKGIMEAIDKSDTVKNLWELRVGRITYGNNYIDKKHAKYLLNRKELFARSYAQYIAEKSNDSILVKQLNKELDKSAPVYYFRQWEKDDFKPIMVEFDKLFKSFGWMK